ncbi:hypothetical protein [Agrobacterium vitis]|uniref:hypothetical protein n=1 Tax=Agrobacterium vitis TaxID=373 RepID=UPI0008DC1B06|nr:hypothetical protein [Agrobacterium vitis]MUO84031.1 hypothetical protein [Agrobacterium vitis]
MTDAEAQLHAVVNAWEALPGGRQCGVKNVESWLARDMAPAINSIRGFLQRPRPDGVLPPCPPDQQARIAGLEASLKRTTDILEEWSRYHSGEMTCDIAAAIHEARTTIAARATKGSADA